MENLKGLDEVRRNLLELVSLAEVVGAEHLTHYVSAQLEQFGTIRSQAYAKPELPEEEDDYPLIAEEASPTATPSRETLPVPKVTPVKVRQPTRAEMPPAPGPSRKVPASTSYNAERYVPIRVLWAKVIIRAAYDYALWKDSKDMRLRKFAQDAERWLFESSDLELSFENICFAFDFPLEKIRLKTRGLTKQDVKKLEFRERHGRMGGLLEDTGGND